MELIEKIYNAGVVGVGGAGFPTHIKLKCKVEYLIINGAECEPLLEVDKYLMREKNREIIRTTQMVGQLIGAKHMFIGLKEKYHEEILYLNEAIKELDAQIQLYSLDNFYPAGDEQVMVHEITGRVIPAGGIPLDIGAVVSNVGTIVGIHDALEDKPVTDKYMTVVGDVVAPGFLQVPIGTSVRTCIEACGGTSLVDYKVILGGPMMGKVIDGQEIDATYVTKTMGALIVVPADHYIVKRKEQPLTHSINQAKTACIQCKMCTDMCPRNLMGHQLRPHKIMRIMGLGTTDEEILKEAMICSECGICELYACPMGLSPRLVNAYVKQELRQKGIRYERQPLNDVNSLRDYRKVPVPRLVARLDLSRFKGEKLNDMKVLEVDKVCISLSQHIGKPATPRVTVGDYVKKGQIIGDVDREDFGAVIHASISGKVCEVSHYITILQDSEVILGD
ncbi:4Fe-4S dicluster domain-containing protein [Vallitalea okinawensis]|uniref:4Fe-4S dicluster domain-containing protein n=1 Tax=Vallitalea okinawensis TaxID=2078660 RepID=UPI000CFB52E6|nr:4Fe-4S dicluster domain-containing protein [Vallitalea okinawensis]